MIKTRRTKLKLKQKFIWEQKEIREKLEKKFVIKIREVNIYPDDAFTPRGDITLTLENGNQVSTRFHMRNEKFIFSFKPAEIDWQLA